MSTVQPSSWQRVQNYACSKAIVGITIAVALAIAILGALALTGQLYPSCPLAALAPIGRVGAGAMMGGGSMTALFALLGKICNPRPVSFIAESLTDAYPPRTVGAGQPGDGPDSRGGDNSRLRHVTFE